MIGRLALLAEQAHAEAAVLMQVEKLQPADQILALVIRRDVRWGRHPAGPRRQRAQIHGGQVRLAQILQPRGPHPLDELVQIEGGIVLLQMVVEQEPVGELQHPVDLVAEHLPIGRRLLAPGPAQRIEQAARLARGLQRIADMPAMVEDHLAQAVPGAPPRQSVVADDRDAPGRQAFAADRPGSSPAPPGAPRRGRHGR